jgi:ribosomal protein S12 methylthiotransferase accessory factor
MTILSKIRQIYSSAIHTKESQGFLGRVFRSVAADDPHSGMENALSTLSKLNLICPGTQGQFALATAAPMETLLPCIDLMDRLPIALVPLESDGCPIRFCSGFVKLEEAGHWPISDDRMIAVGQGITDGDALISCLGEMAERVSILSRMEAEPLVVHSPNADVSAVRFVRFSRDQQARMLRDIPQLSDDDGRPDIDWEGQSDRRIALRSIHGGPDILTPSLVCLLQEGRFYNVPHIQITSSNGAASWWNHEGALKRAVLELVERDAVACWWYNRLSSHRLRQAYAMDCLPRPLADWFTDRERDTHFLRLATDLGCHVIAAISYNSLGNTLAYGFKAGLDECSAVNGAAIEMVQMEMHLQNIQDTVPGAKNGEIDHPLLRLSIAVNVKSQDWLQGETASDKNLMQEHSWSDLVQKFETEKIPIWYFDATRDDFGVPTIKAISTELRDWMPRFGPGRLYDLPVKLGLREKASCQQDLNPIQFVC